jgi:hypothetical protein
MEEGLLLKSSVIPSAPISVNRPIDSIGIVTPAVGIRRRAVSAAARATREPSTSSLAKHPARCVPGSRPRGERILPPFYDEKCCPAAERTFETAVTTGAKNSASRHLAEPSFSA